MKNTKKQRNVSPSEQKEDEGGPMPTSAIKALLKKWEDVRAMVLEWHPYQADVSSYGSESCCHLDHHVNALMLDESVETQSPDWGINSGGDALSLLEALGPYAKVARPSKGEEKRREGGRKSTRWRSERTWQIERDSDYVGEDRNKMAQEVIFVDSDKMQKIAVFLMMVFVMSAVVLETNGQLGLGLGINLCPLNEAGCVNQCVMNGHNTGFCSGTFCECSAGPYIGKV
ncbi:uncharacterized protein TNCV_4444151 [Trichonephila clavipes]|nr:uncharacterized protein TNCV_4444151 [Trichonephila clavipes]